MLLPRYIAIQHINRMAQPNAQAKLRAESAHLANHTQHPHEARPMEPPASDCRQGASDSFLFKNL